MPNLACWSCGRQIYTVAPLEALFAEERRCPRCGAFLREDRRVEERRKMHRRTNPTHDPGPPKPAPGSKARSKSGPTASSGAKGRKRARPAAVDGDGSSTSSERRVADRRTGQRRGGGPPRRPGSGSEGAGSQD